MAGHLTAGPTHQVSGPVWLNDDSECFDISAKALAETPKAQIRAMVQTLLTERFKLALHRETRELPIYVLETARRGPRLSSSGPDAGHSVTRSVGGNVTATNVSMTEFAYQLSRWLKRPVFDQTRLRGKFDFTLQLFWLAIALKRWRLITDHI